MVTPRTKHEALSQAAGSTAAEPSIARAGSAPRSGQRRLWLRPRPLATSTLALLDGRGRPAGHAELQTNVTELSELRAEPEKLAWRARLQAALLELPDASPTTWRYTSSSAGESTSGCTNDRCGSEVSSSMRSFANHG